MKKSISVLLVVCMIVSLVALMGCQKDENQNVNDNTKNSDNANGSKDNNNAKSNSENDGEENNKNEGVSDEITFPLEEKITLSAFVHTRPNVDNFDDNEFTKWLEEKANVEFEFITAPENEKEQKLNLLLATSDYPDYIFSKAFNTAQQAYYGSQGLLVPLNDLIDKYGEYTNLAFEEYPVVKELYTMPDGNIYNLPEINACYHCQATQKLWVYTPWLEELGLELPETTDDFYDMLVAFRDEDPNGNGLNDEVPLSGAVKGWETNVEAFIMNAFVYNATSQSGANHLFVDNGKVAASYTQDGWKEGLKYLQKLRKEGLLDTNSFTQDNQALKQLGENPDDVILGAVPGGSMGVFSQLFGESTRWKEYKTISPLEGPEGLRTTKYNPFIGSPGVSITDACENPDIAFKIVDMFYSEEGTYRSLVGREGIEYELINDDSILGINGLPALRRKLLPLDKQDPNVHWNQLGPNLRSSSWRLGREADPEASLNEIVLYEETRDKYEPYFPSTDVLLPPLILSKDQSATLLTYSTTINNYVDEKIAYFILGDIDIEAEWDKYISELEAMGINKMLDVYQEAYDAR